MKPDEAPIKIETEAPDEDTNDMADEVPVDDIKKRRRGTTEPAWRKRPRTNPCIRSAPALVPTVPTPYPTDADRITRDWT